MADRKVIILGGRGMLGTDILAACHSSGIDATACDLPDLDITNEQHLVNVITPGHVLINCAAYTNVEKAESEPDPAFKVNAHAVGRIGRIAAQQNVPVIHISTDFVFDGNLDRPYCETDPANPISVYGQSKYDGERALAESGCKHAVIRVQWTYGHAGTNFVKKIIELARTRDALKVIADQVGSPTSTREAAKAVLNFVQKETCPQGVFHFAAAGYVSRYEMARYIFDKLDIQVKVDPCKTSDFKTAARRPLNSRFNCDKIQALLDHPIRSWEAPLEEFLAEL